MKCFDKDTEYDIEFTQMRFDEHRENWDIYKNFCKGDFVEVIDGSSGAERRKAMLRMPGITGLVHIPNGAMICKNRNSDTFYFKEV